ncbi:hypothetical protein GBAR_LOCUS7569 [Geodia barretti]|uniref:Methylated-DNA-[protein]-cysteine S-methyltransferase DNA binding domain-containing protein n=1 Tax=Geodia barretti TaxID=519541 RepID=A0AA35RHX6_GEOBA|nr:hypothetical protein GBAR_LOCUS7569 [Geodia barretti]
MRMPGRQGGRVRDGQSWEQWFSPTPTSSNNGILWQILDPVRMLTELSWAAIANKANTAPGQRGSGRFHGVTPVLGDVPAMPPVYARVLDVVREIPHGQVATYGQIAQIVGGCTPRMVGFAWRRWPGTPRTPVPKCRGSA